MRVNRRPFLPLCRATVAHRVQAQTLLPSSLHRPGRAFTQQPETQLCSEFHFRSARGFCARRPALQPAHPNTARCGLSSDAHAGATRRSGGHRHAGAVRWTGVSLAFCCLCTRGAQAASHSTADKSNHLHSAHAAVIITKFLHKPLTICIYTSPSLLSRIPPNPYFQSQQPPHFPHPLANPSLSTRTPPPIKSSSLPHHTPRYNLVSCMHGTHPPHTQSPLRPAPANPGRPCQPFMSRLMSFNPKINVHFMPKHTLHHN